MPLSIIPLPLSVFGPPDGYGWEERSMSNLSTSTAFATGINTRDTFLGEPCCIICGHKTGLEHCHIIMQSQPKTWTMLKSRRWLPDQVKDHPQHEPRDGLLMCRNHHYLFDTYAFFIRFFPTIRKFVCINYSGEDDLQPYDGKAIALDINDRHAPFPSLFIIHEMRVRGFHPFQPIVPNMPDDVLWQDWISLRGVFNDTTNSFIRDLPQGNNGGTGSSQAQPPMTSAGGGTSGSRTLALNEDVIADILAATRAMPSWKACQIEGTSWAGSAEENIQKYASFM